MQVIRYLVWLLAKAVLPLRSILKNVLIAFTFDRLRAMSLESKIKPSFVPKPKTTPDQTTIGKIPSG